MTGRTRTVTLAAAVALLTSAPAVTAAADDATGVKGAFSAPFSEEGAFDAQPPRTNEESKRFPTAVHMAVMPDGRVVYWGGFETVEELNGGMPIDGGRANRTSRSRVLDIRSGVPRWAAPLNNSGGPRPYEDLFCTDQRVLPDGRVLAVGGSIWRNDPVDLTPATGEGGPGGTIEVKGSDATRWIDARDEQARWHGADENRMNEPRWYPTLMTLSDGRMLVASGVRRLVFNAPGLEQGSKVTNVRRLETFDPERNRWSLEPRRAGVSLPLYPRLHLTHDGNVLYAGSGIMWSPFGESGDEALWNLHQLYDPENKKWSPAGVGAFGARSDPVSVPLMLSAPYDRTRILVAGGTLGVSPTTYPGTNLSEVVTYERRKTNSRPTGPLTNRRWFSSGVLLPSGEVVALAGSENNGNVGIGTDIAVRQAELFDPDSETWIPLATAARERTYHNTALLLPDGRVLLGGHAPQPAGQGDHPDDAGIEGRKLASNLKDPSFEIFTPPYLDPSRGERPKVGFAPARMRNGREYGVKVEGDVPVDKLVLMRLPSVTHAMDADQRGIELELRRSGKTLHGTVPRAEVVPPGFYYLFALSDSGVPSKARIVQVGPQVGSGGHAPAPFGV